MRSAGMRSLAVSFPRTVRTNDYYRERFPGLVTAEEEKSLARLFAAPRTPSSDPFLEEMGKYVSDPFRGAVERRVLGPGEKALDIEVPAARAALELAGLAPGDVDAMIVSSFQPDQLDVGNAVFLAKALGIQPAAWNLEASCASSIVGLSTASALVQAGHHESVLVVVSCTYSRVADDTDTLSWFLGDGAAAFVVGPVPEGEGLLGSFTRSTTETCNTFYATLAAGHDDRIVMRCTPETGRIIHETSQPYLVACTDKALARAGLDMKGVDFVVPNTPSAFFSAFVARVLGIDPERTISTYDRFANIGNALMPANLHAAVSQGKIKPGDAVLLYGFGGVSAASAAVMRLGDVPVRAMGL